MYAKKGSGFTLVEVLVTLAIVAILVTLVYPVSIESIRKARRADATNTLQDLSTNQAQWRANHTTYATNVADVGYPGGVSTEGNYSIAFVGTPNAASYLATATPTGAQSADSCGTFAINQDGPLTTTGYADASCWNR